MADPERAAESRRSDGTSKKTHKGDGRMGSSAVDVKFNVGSSDACITLHALNSYPENGVAHPGCREVLYFQRTPSIGLIALIGRFHMGRNRGEGS